MTSAIQSIPLSKLISGDANLHFRRFLIQIRAGQRSLEAGDLSGHSPVSPARRCGEFVARLTIISNEISPPVPSTRTRDLPLARKACDRLKRCRHAAKHERVGEFTPPPSGKSTLPRPD